MAIRIPKNRRVRIALLVVGATLLALAARSGYRHYQHAQERAYYAQRQQAHIDRERAAFIERKDELHEQAREHFLNGDADIAVGSLKRFESFLDGELLALYKLALEQAPAAYARRQAAENAAARAQETERLAREERACKANLQCWAKKHEVDAQTACTAAVERSAKYQSEWTNGFLEKRFHPMSFGTSGNTVVWGGDKVKFQNGFGAWQVMVYACEFDPTSRRAVDIAVRERD